MKRFGTTGRPAQSGDGRKAQRAHPLKPDLAWYRNGSWEAVLDVKYKPLYSDAVPERGRVPDAGIHPRIRTRQGLACLRARATTGERRARHPLGGKTIMVTALDVTREPEDLLAEVDALAERIAASAHTMVAAA